MARDGSGTYNLPAGNPVVTGTTISSSTTNTTNSDLASALTQSVSKDGQTAYTANQPMGGFKHTAVANASARDQYASAGQIQDGALIYLGAVAGTNTITASANPAISAYVAGQMFLFIPANSTTSTSTLNINGVGAKNIFINGVAALGFEIRKNCPITVLYDGTQFHIIAGAFGGDGGAIGEVKCIAGTGAPTGWLLLYGQAVSRTTYADLFVIIGTTFGVGDGATTFNLPDLRGRTPFGKDDMGGSAANRVTNAISGITGTTLGSTGGSESLTAHTHTGTTGTESATHTHAITDPGHVHREQTIGGAASLVGGGGGATTIANTTTSDGVAALNTQSAVTGISLATESANHTHSFTSASTGAGAAQNMPPAIVLNFVIKY